MPEGDPDELADELEQQAEKLDRHSDEVERHVEETRQDWRRKREDENVPGAPPEGDDSPVGADEQPPPEARREG